MNVESDANVIFMGDLEDSLEYATFGDLLVKRLKSGGNKISMINGVTDQKWTFNDVLAESIKAAKALYGSGICQNDVISILSDNRIEFAAISYGALFLNAAIAPINIMYTEHEEKIEGKRQILWKKLVAKYGESNFDVEKFIQQPIKIFEQTTMIFMSSGTTGLPKGVELSQGNLIACAVENFRKVRINLQLFGRLDSLSVVPWFHAMGFMGKIWCTTSSEATYVFLNKFEPNSYLECIQKHKIVSLLIPPPIIAFLAKFPLFYKYDLSSLRYIICGAAPLSKELEDQVKERFGSNLKIFQGYGQTEATLGVLLCEIETAKPGSVGEVIKGTYAKIVNEIGNSLGPNKVGELCFKGPQIMKGYRNNTEATSITIDKNGWLHSGDLGYYDEDKQFFIVDRLKELIKYKGYQVPPAELEGILLTHPKIKDAGVIGIADEIAGELPFAFVVKEEGCDLTEQEVKDFVANNVSNPKWLRGGVKFIDEIPKNPSGKILRREMRELHKTMKAKL